MNRSRLFHIQSFRDSGFFHCTDVQIAGFSHSKFYRFWLFSLYRCTDRGFFTFKVLQIPAFFIVQMNRSRLFHIQSFTDSGFFHCTDRSFFTHSVAPWLETHRKIANVVGKLSRLSEIVKVVDGGGGGGGVKI